MTPEQLVCNHRNIIYALCLAYTKNLHDAEDAAQEVFLKAVRNLTHLRNPRKTKSWLLQIARNTCLDYLRWRNKTPANTTDNTEFFLGSSNEPDPRIPLLQEAISELPVRYREVICLYYMDGRNCREVGCMLGITETTVRQRLFRARLMLHELIGKTSHE